MPDRFDIVVVGAGPAGLVAGLEARAAGCEVAVVEKHDRVGYPLNCGEGVTVGSMMPLLDLQETWIAAHIHRGLLISPSGYRFLLHHPDAGLVLNRPAMEQDLASRFVAAGGTLFTGTRAEGIHRGINGFESLSIVAPDEKTQRTLVATVFIAADGVEGTVARWAGIDNHIELKLTERFYQYRLNHISVESDLMEVHLGSSVAPGSYCWVFPKGTDQANVGLGVGPGFDREPRALLDRFVADRFPGAEIVNASCGTSPRYQGASKQAKKNLLVVGDAARLLDSVTGAGIANAILSGKLAGRAAAAFCRSGARSLDEMYRTYPGEFLEHKHETLERYLQIRAFMDRLSDSDYDEMVLGLSDLLGTKNVDSINPIGLFLRLITKRPRLLKLARHFFGPL